MEPEQQNKNIASKQIKGTIHQNYFLGKFSSLVFFLCEENKQNVRASF